MMSTREEKLLPALTDCGDPSAAIEGAHQIFRRTGWRHHDLLVVLGSGAQDALSAWGEPDAVLPLSDLPGVLPPTAPGHENLLCAYARPLLQAGGQATAVRVLVARGRTHLYEGHGADSVTALARVAAATGIKSAVLINANGCLCPWKIGEVMTITDHLNFTGYSAFTGPVFVDLRQVWDPDLIQVLRPLTQRTGVYAALRGPEYQTLAESRYLAAAGAHAVGMSTVLEAIVLHHLGVRVAGLSVVSDLSFASEPTDPQTVVSLVANANTTLLNAVEAVAAQVAKL